MTQFPHQTKWLYKGRSYSVVDFCRIKDATTGNWISGVIYENEEGETFVRSRLDFVEKFQCYFPFSEIFEECYD